MRRPHRSGAAIAHRHPRLGAPPRPQAAGAGGPEAGAPGADGGQANGGASNDTVEDAQFEEVK